MYKNQYEIKTKTYANNSIKLSCISIICVSINAAKIGFTLFFTKTHDMNTKDKNITIKKLVIQ